MSLGKLFRLLDEEPVDLDPARLVPRQAARSAATPNPLPPLAKAVPGGVVPLPDGDQGLRDQSEVGGDEAGNPRAGLQKEADPLLGVGQQAQDRRTERAAPGVDLHLLEAGQRRLSVTLKVP
ncbi:MAG: hypothetical protein HC813_00280 [Planctomycetes bacterium]|nr:hypothetical protein [Planctomycetota bacterium]